jgi:hypothetical protein
LAVTGKGYVSVGKPAVAVADLSVRPEVRIRLARVVGLGLDPGSMALRHLGHGIDHVAVGSAADGQEHTRPIARTDEHVPRPPGAMHEIPGEAAIGTF